MSVYSGIGIQLIIWKSYGHFCLVPSNPPTHLESEAVVALVGGPAADPERGEVHRAVVDVAERRTQRLPAHRNLRLPLAVRLAPPLLET